MIKAYFSNIKELLIENINKSKSSIKIAVAWFTQRELFKSLMNAINRNVKVSLILVDDIINRSEYGLDFSSFLNKGGRLCFVNNKKILMHDKFCIFDDNILVTGSYNWTYSAESRNAENIISTDDVKVCSDFVLHYNDLWNSLSETNEYQHLKISDSDDKEFVSLYDDILNEYSVMSSKKLINDVDIDTIRNRKNNIAIKRLAAITTSHNRKNPRLKMNIGMRCKINGIENKVLKILPKGKSLPFTNKTTTQTAEDNQTNALCDIVYGNRENADDNKSLVQIELTDLPPQKEGEVKFETKVTLDTNGYMHVEYLCTNTGVSKEAIYVNPDLIEYN